MNIGFFNRTFRAHSAPPRPPPPPRHPISAVLRAVGRPESSSPMTAISVAPVSSLRTKLSERSETRCTLQQQRRRPPRRRPGTEEPPAGPRSLPCAGWSRPRGLGFLGVVAFALLWEGVQGSCPNQCSGHGFCGVGDACTCFAGHNASTDCSLRTCDWLCLAWHARLGRGGRVDGLKPGWR